MEQLRRLETWVRDNQNNSENWATEDRVSGRWKLKEEMLDEVPFEPVFAAARIESGETHGRLFIVSESGRGKYRISHISVSFREVPEQLKYDGEGAVKQISFGSSGTAVWSNLEKQEAIDVVKGIVKNLKVR